MKVVVTGGRDYFNRNIINQYLDWVHRHCPITTLIHGDATGADTLCKEWAEAKKVIKVISFPVTQEDWKAKGKAAGHIRNGVMLDNKPDCVIAFPGGPGTNNCRQQAKKRGIRVIGPFV